MEVIEGQKNAEILKDRNRKVAEVLAASEPPNDPVIQYLIQRIKAMLAEQKMISTRYREVLRQVEVLKADILGLGGALQRMQSDLADRLEEYEQEKEEGNNG